jgi:hypothetical protein
MACPAGRVVIHNFARRAILDAVAPADRLLDVGCGGGLLLRLPPRAQRDTHDTIQSLEETLREHDAAVLEEVLKSSSGVGQPSTRTSSRSSMRT